MDDSHSFCVVVFFRFFVIYTQVRFPLDGLDLSPYVASAAAAQRERKKEAGRAVNDRDKGGDQCPSSLPPSSPSNTAAAATGVATCSFLPSSSSSSQYTLYAIIHHVGAMQAGHYVATVRVEQGGRWYCFNDSRVSSSAVFPCSSMPSPLSFAFPLICTSPCLFHIIYILYSHSRTDNRCLAFTIIPPPPVLLQSLLGGRGAGRGAGESVGLYPLLYSEGYGPPLFRGILSHAGSAGWNGEQGREGGRGRQGGRRSGPKYEYDGRGDGSVFAEAGCAEQV